VKIVSILLLFIFGFSATQITNVCLDCQDFQEASIEKLDSLSMVKISSDSETQTQGEKHISIGCHCSAFSFQQEITYDFSSKIKKQICFIQKTKSPPVLEGPFQPPRLRA